MRKTCSEDAMPRQAENTGIYVSDKGQPLSMVKITPKAQTL